MTDRYSKPYSLKQIAIPIPPKRLKLNLTTLKSGDEVCVNGARGVVVDINAADKIAIVKFESRFTAPVNIGSIKIISAVVDEEDEWPQAGDEVELVSMGMTTYNKLVRLTYIGDGVGCYVDLTNGMEYTYAKRETVFKKPKAPEEELRDENARDYS